MTKRTQRQRQPRPISATMTMEGHPPIECVVDANGFISLPAITIPAGAAITYTLDVTWGDDEPER